MREQRKHTAHPGHKQLEEVVQNTQSHRVADGCRDICSEEVAAEDPQPHPHGEHTGCLEEDQQKDPHGALSTTQRASKKLGSAHHT